MTKSLRERYAQKKLNAINEKVAKKAKSQLLINENMSRLLIEAMDDNDLRTAEQIITKLRKMKGHGMKNLDISISEAEAEINKYTGGGSISQAWTKIKSSLGFDNPLVKIMTFANALEKGFKQMPTIIKNVIGGNEGYDESSSITDMGLSEEQQKTIINNMRKALSPEGIFGMFKKVPYINKDKLISDLVTVPVKSLMNVVNVSNSGPQTDKIAKDIQGQFAGGSQTNKTTPGTPTTSSEETSGTKPTTGTIKSQGSKSSEERTNTGTLKTITDDVLQKMSTDSTVITQPSFPKSVKASLVWLEKNGYITMNQEEE